MQKKINRSKPPGAVLLTLVLVALFNMAAVCEGQDWTRAGRVEIFAMGQAMSGDDTTGLGLSLEIDDGIVGGLGLAFNLKEHINLNADLWFGASDLTVKGFQVLLTGNPNMLGTDFNVGVNFLKSRFTPVVSAFP
jgi:hypothetical protein